MIALEILLVFANALRCLFEILEVYDGADHQFLVGILHMDHRSIELLIRELNVINNHIINARGQVEQLQELFNMQLEDCMRDGM